MSSEPESKFVLTVFFVLGCFWATNYFLHDDKSSSVPMSSGISAEALAGFNGGASKQFLQMAPFVFCGWRMMGGESDC